MRKGEVTRERILEGAMALASRIGFESLSIGVLASELGLSKSGLFAHFGSKEELQLRTLEAAVARFEVEVFHPAITRPRGEPRLRAIFENWLTWDGHNAWPGGCLITAASVEYDDRPGPVRDLTVEAQTRLLEGVARAVRIAIEVGHFRENVDPEQVAYEIYGIVLAHQFIQRLRRDPKADDRARAAFEHLLDQSQRH
ncbi:MAG: TetR/AcrR family transcriptional regulator [Myxococcaceae bacterium]